MAQGRYAQAEVLYRSLLAAEPDDGQLRVRHGDTLKRLNRVDEAVEAYRLASASLANAGHLARALAALRLAIELRPDDVELISELIRLEVQKNGRPVSARSMASLEPKPQLALPARPGPRHQPHHHPPAPPPVEDDWVDIAVTGPKPSLELPIVEAAISSEYPMIRRLSPREVAVKPAPQSPWVLVSSATTVFVRFEPELQGDATEEEA